MSDTGIKHTCDDCDRKFKTVKTLKTHMKHFHNNNATGSNDGDYNVAQSDGQLHSDEDSKTSQPSSKEYDSDDSTFIKWSTKISIRFLISKISSIDVQLNIAPASGVR